MQNSTFDNSFVNRLRDMVANRYGKSLIVRRLMDMGDCHQIDCFTKGNDLHIPINVNGSLLGTAIVSSARELDLESRDNMTQLIRMVLEPAMYNWYLEQKESNLAEITRTNFAPENVRIFGDSAPDDEEDIYDTEIDEDNILISHLIHLQGPSENKNKKIALLLHEITRRWAFVPFNDIKGQIHSTQDISRMGSMTIFIENVEKLNPAEQELIEEYLSEERFQDEPLLITTSMLNLEGLGQTTLRTNIIDELSINLFEVEKAPLDPQNLKEVLELFYLKDSVLDS